MARESNSNRHRRRHWWRVAIGLCCLAAAFAPRSTPGAAAVKEAAEKEYKTPVTIRFDGMITGLNEQFLLRQLESARSRGADLLIIEIDSPGGYLEESLNLAHALADIDWAHTVAYVPREAISGGAIMALGCDEIIMRPSAQLGDAGPIYQGEGFFFRYAEAKIETYLAGEVRTLAEQKNRPPAVAEAMVDKDLLVYHVRDAAGNETFLSEAELNEAPAGKWEKLAEGPIAESRGDRFLQVSGQRAVALDLAAAVVDNREELHERFGLKEDPPVYQWGWVDTTVAVLTHWTVSILLIVVGLVALYFELAHPGLSLGGLIAGLCFVLFFWAHFMGGTAAWLEIILFIAGVAFLAVEIFVIPGFGWAGIFGILLMVAGVLLACQDFIIPQSTRDLQTMVYALLTVLGATIGFIIAAATLSRHMGSLPVLNQLLLAPPTPDEEGEEEEADEKDGAAKAPGKARRPGKLQAGDWGTAHTALRPAGKIRIGEDYYDVVADSAYIDRGRQVKIVDVRGTRIVVREVPPAE